MKLVLPFAHLLTHTLAARALQLLAANIHEYFCAYIKGHGVRRCVFSMLSAREKYTIYSLNAFMRAYLLIICIYSVFHRKLFPDAFAKITRA